MAESKKYYTQSSDGRIYLTKYPPSSDTVLPNSKGKELFRLQCIEHLRSVLPPGKTVYTHCNYISSSGMSRRISTYIVSNDRIQDITYWVSVAIERTIREGKRGMTISGCGMDMGFSIVYDLSNTLFPMKDSSDGGYVLKHEWL